MAEKSPKQALLSHIDIIQAKDIFMELKHLLTPRLQTIAGEAAAVLSSGDVIADIGSDHAYIPIVLLKNNLASTAYVTDIHQGPLIRSQKNIAVYDLNDKIQALLGDGILPLRGIDIDLYIMAGMGGELICSILDKSGNLPTKMILQPMTACYELRKYLGENQYAIQSEILCSEKNKIYTVITAEKINISARQEEKYYYISQKLLERGGPLLELFQKKQIETVQKAIAQITRFSQNSSALKKQEELLTYYMGLQNERK